MLEIFHLFHLLGIFQLPLSSFKPRNQQGRPPVRVPARLGFANDAKLV